MDTDLIRTVGRGLRYWPLQHLVGRSVWMANLDAVEEAVRLGLGPDLPLGCSLVGPEPNVLRGTVARYGILDLRFTASTELLTGDVRTGMPLLRELGFLPGGEVGPQHRICDDPTCLEMLQDEVDEGRAWLLLLLEGDRPCGEARVERPDGHVSFRLPEGYLPRPFRVVDACVSNASSVWLWKHFYP